MQENPLERASPSWAADMAITLPTWQTPTGKSDSADRCEPAPGLMSPSNPERLTSRKASRVRSRRIRCAQTNHDRPAARRRKHAATPHSARHLRRTGPRRSGTDLRAASARSYPADRHGGLMRGDDHIAPRLPTKQREIAATTPLLTTIRPSRRVMVVLVVGHNAALQVRPDDNGRRTHRGGVHPQHLHGLTFTSALRCAVSATISSSARCASLTSARSGSVSGWTSRLADIIGSPCKTG